MPAITLREVTRDNWRAALELVVQPEQQQFVAGVVPPVAIALAKAYIRPSGQPVLPLAIYADDNICGFLNLTYEPASQDHYWIHHFFIDQRYQGRGWGTAALTALVTLLHTDHPTCRSLCLTVHPDNHVAQRFYKNFGFADTGNLLDGELIYRLAVLGGNYREE